MGEVGIKAPRTPERNSVFLKVGLSVHSLSAHKLVLWARQWGTT